MPKLLTLRRELVTSDHQALRDHIPRVNHELSDIQPKWRRLGEAGITLFERGEFETAIHKPKSRLAQANPYTLATTFNTSIIPRMPTEPAQVNLSVSGIDFMGEGPYRSIAFLLDAEQVMDERERLLDILDKMNGLNLHWRSLKPHVSVATIDQANAEPRVVEAFESINPTELRFKPLIAGAL